MASSLLAISSAEGGSGSDNFVWESLYLYLLNAHLCSVFKVKPELSVANNPVLHESFRRVVFINDWITCSSSLDLLLDLVVCLVSLS